MLKIAILVLTLALASASFEDEWKSYKQKYNKIYSNREDSLRRYIYQSNMREIQEHNELYAQGKSSFYLGENQFADLTTEEFAKRMNGLKVKVEADTVDEEDMEEDPSVENKKVDWRKKGYVTPVKDQGDCGSCWAFSVTGTLEGQHFAATKKLVSLSESNLMDCSGRYGNLGCDGGDPIRAYRFIIAEGGIDSEASYPYMPKNRDCNFTKAGIGATMAGYRSFGHGNEKALQKHLRRFGPLSVAIDASHKSFQLYKGGVYDEPNCSSTDLDHAVLLVGYDTTPNGTEYFIVKNSWNTTWGIEGYVWMSRNKHNQCGIASYVSCPEL